jgi:DNA polymerase-1
MHRIVLIDADIDLYQISQQNQTEVHWDESTISMSFNLANAKHVFDETIAGIVQKVEADSYLLCISGDNNFRKKNFPEYKANRKDVRKPMGYQELKKHAMENHPYKMYDELEADDVMGIMATKSHDNDYEYVIHSDDKDLKTIPALIWDRFSKKVVRTSELEANRFLYTQILTGDVTDGYKGCPKIGKLKAQKALAVCSSELEMREAAFQLYLKEYKDDMTAREKMMIQAGQARILRSSDYDFKNKSVIIWHPWRNSGNIKEGSAVQETTGSGQLTDSVPSTNQ